MTMGRSLGRLPVILGVTLVSLLVGGILYGITSRLEKANQSAGAGAGTVPLTGTLAPGSQLMTEMPAGGILAAQTPEPEAIAVDPLPAPPAISPSLATVNEEILRLQHAALIQEMNDRQAGIRASPIVVTRILSPGETPAPVPASFDPVDPLDLAAPVDPSSGRLEELARLAALGHPEGVSDQARKLAFVQETGQQDWILPSTREAATRYEIKSGAIIPAVMMTGINSDLPGRIIAQTSQHVYDTATGRFVLIPQGSKLLGRYQSQVSYGQNRTLAVWDRVIYPDGSALDLGGMQGVDEAGVTGFKDRVNNHYWRTFGQIFLLSAFQGAAAREARASPGDAEFDKVITANTSEIGVRVTEKNLAIQPTLTIRPGYRFKILVNQDILFETPYATL